ncbi:MAG: Unknown protein [uncultured Sulfurovum sp.]|uniref:Uncharacterized protein n=1 Tax=uncultured Sulfurovum sp. TaxID=269237 RepID=A0A6S6S144_9BACT|nr:MAG: Unknown protein [uncultured Sulfurovum sp.]
MFKLLTPFIVLLLLIASLLILEERRTFDVSTLVHIDPIPHTEKLIKQKKYVEAEEYLTYFMAYDYVKNNPKSSKLIQIIQEKRNSFSYKTDKFLEGIIQGKSDDDIGRTSAIASDFLVIGDIRDLAIEGMHYNNGEKVDKLILSLSTLGLLASATTVYSLGATAPIKGSISLLKYGKRLNQIPIWLQTKLIKQTELAKKTKSLKEVQKLLEPIQKLYNKVGLNQTLYLLSKSRNLKELTSLNKFATRFGKKSQVLLKSSNNSALTYMKKMPNVSKKNFLYASTYGEQGLKGMNKLGASKFIKRVGFTSNLAKTTYKGNLDSLFNALLKKIPNSLLYVISFLGLFYFIRKLFVFTTKLRSIII